MGRLVANSFVTLDGVIQGPGGSDEDREDGFEHGGWQFPFMDEESGAVILGWIERMDALLLGRKTYDIWVGYWPKAPADDPIGAKLNAVPKYVASRTLDHVDWDQARLIEGDLATAVRAIKDQHDEVHVWGSADLLRSLLREGLVDRFATIVYPVVLGTGKRLFSEGTDATRFKLIESRPFKGGGVLMTYEHDGKPEYGTMGQNPER